MCSSDLQVQISHNACFSWFPCFGGGKPEVQLQLLRDQTLVCHNFSATAYVPLGYIKWGMLCMCLHVVHGLFAFPRQGTTLSWFSDSLIFIHIFGPDFHRTNTLIYIENSFSANKISLAHTNTIIQRATGRRNASPTKPLQLHKP